MRLPWKEKLWTNIEITTDYGMTMEMRAWLYDNKIRRYKWTTINGKRYLSFMNEEDAMAFKLAWMYI